MSERLHEICILSMRILSYVFVMMAPAEMRGYVRNPRESLGIRTSTVQHGDHAMRRMLTLLAVSLSTVIGCGGDSTGPTTTSLAGTWNLSTINGSPLPYIAQAANPKVEILSDQIIASAGGTFTETGSYRVTNAGVVSTQPITDSGTWTVNGTAATFHFNSDGSSGTGTVSGNTFTVAADGFSEVYVKQ